MRPKRKGSIKKGGTVPPQDQHVVTAYPTAASGSPTPGVTITNPNNMLLDDGNLVTIDPAGGTVAIHYEAFNLEDVLPLDAVIDQVEIEFEARHDGTVADAAARPQVNPRVNSVASPGGWVGPTTVTNTLALYTQDVTSHPGADGGVAWGSAVWTRAMLVGDTNFKIGTRSRNVGDVAGTHAWDFVRVKVTYTGSPPETPVQVRHPLDVGTVGDGDGGVTGPGIDTADGDTDEEYPAGTNVPLVPVPQGGSLFNQWEGDASGQSNPLIVVMDGPKSIDARFVGTPPGDPVELHWGEVVAEDLGIAVNGRDTWLGQSTPWYSDQHVSESGDPDDDPYVERHAETGLWVPHERSTPSTHYRRMIAPVAPPQAIYDSHVNGKHWPDDENATTRCQLQRWSQSSAWHIWHEGDRDWTVFGFRLMEDSPLTEPIHAGGGNNLFTQLVQWKVKTAGGFSNVDSFGVGSNGVKAKYDDLQTGNTYEDMFPCEAGVWQRIAVEKLWSSNANVGYYTVWGKLDGETTWQQLTPKRFMRTLVAGGYANMGFGPYHDIRLCTDNTLYYCDYRDFQVIRYV